MESGDVRLGYVFMSTSAQSMNAYVTDNLQVFFLSALGVLTLTFIVLYALTYRMVRPLRQMAAATRALGRAISASASRSRARTRWPSWPPRSTAWRFPSRP